MQKAQGPGVCKLPKPPASRALCQARLLLPSIFPSIRVFSNELALPIRWPKYWSFSFRVSPCNPMDYSLPGSSVHVLYEFFF